MPSFAETLDAAGLVANEFDHATDWPELIGFDRLVWLQYPNHEELRNGLKQALERAWKRHELPQKRELAWVGFYANNQGTNHPYTRTLESSPGIDAENFARWLEKTGTKPSEHVACWFEQQGIHSRFTDTAKPAPVVATSNGKKWTPEKLAELKAYREAHTEPETAKQFGISGARIRQLLPTGKPQKKPYSVFTHHIK